MRARLLVVLLIVVVGVTLDLWTKAWAEGSLKGNPSREVVAHVFHLTYAENPHGAFSLFRGVPEWLRRGGLIVASLLAVGVIGWLLLRSSTSRWMVLAFSLVLSGALGNLYDRLLLGHVRDFIDWHIDREGARWFTWPTFNLADSYITVGVTLLVIITIFGRAHGPEAVEKRTVVERPS
jgi:signal peptidase II